MRCCCLTNIQYMQVCGANVVGCLHDEDCSSGLFCNTGHAQPRWFFWWCDQSFHSSMSKKTKKSRLILKGARISMSAMQIIFTSMGWNIAGITQHAGVNQLSHSIFDSVGYFRVWNICEFWFNLIICSNTVGSLSCSCTSGYVEWSAINGCRDKNECTEVPTYFQCCQ